MKMNKVRPRHLQLKGLNRQQFLNIQKVSKGVHSSLRNISVEGDEYKSEETNSSNSLCFKESNEDRRNLSQWKNLRRVKRSKLFSWDKAELQLKYTLIHCGIKKKLAECLPNIKSKRFFRLRSPNRFQDVMKKCLHSNKGNCYFPPSPLSPQPIIRNKRYISIYYCFTI